jgi:hypothetical protein
MEILNYLKLNLIQKIKNNFIKFGIILSTLWLTITSSIYFLLNHFMPKVPVDKFYFGDDTLEIISYGDGVAPQLRTYLTGKDFFNFGLLPIIIFCLSALIIFWLHYRNILTKIKKNINKYRITIEVLLIGFLIYLFSYSYICSVLNLNVSFLTIPYIIFIALLNKTLWFFIFLFWFGKNLLSILKDWSNLQNKS